MSEKKETLNKFNSIKNDFIKVKREKEFTKKPEIKAIQNALLIQPTQTLEEIKSNTRNMTATNKNGEKYKNNNYKQLKITTKNKENEIKDLSPSSIITNENSNILGILLPKKIQGRSLPKKHNHNYISNNNFDSSNYNSNNIKRITSSNNIKTVNNEINNINIKTDNFKKIQTPNHKVNSIGFKGIKKNIIKNENNKELKQNKFINKNNQLKKISNQKEIFNDSINTNNTKINANNIYLGIKVSNKPTNNFNRLRTNNSFNNSSINNFKNRINYNNNERYNTAVFKNRIIKSSNIQNLIPNSVNIHKSKKSMSSSLNIPRNKLKEKKNQDLINGFVIIPEIEIMKNTNNNVMFNTILEYNENQKYKNKILKLKTEHEKNVQKKKNNLYQYLILKGNASYLVKHCMAHRVNWAPVENPPDNFNAFNFKWKELSYGIDYNSLNRNPAIKQIVNHYENHYVLSNKANMFINLMKYCEQRKISLFKYVPFTIVFKIKDRRKIKNIENQNKWTEKLEKLKNFIQNIDKNVKNYNEIGKFYYNDEYIKDKEKRNEFEIMKLIKMNKRKKEKELEDNKEKDKFKKDKINKEDIQIEEEKYNGKFIVYSDIFPRLKITDKLPNRYISGVEDKDKDKKNDKLIGNNTLIEIPTTHFQGKNMWVLKAVNLNRGMCIKVVNSFEQMEKVINKFKNGVDYRFTVEEIEEEQNQFPKYPQALSEDETTKTKKTYKKPNSIQIDEYEEDKKKAKSKKKEKIKTDENIRNSKNTLKNTINLNNENKKGKEEDKDEKIYNCTKIVIQKYIENPLLYKGRKCDMRIWVLLTHQMKVFLFKEGHLKTCSVEYDLNSKNAFTHITNYSFQKYNSNFQKFEKGNEVPFYEFQKFLDSEYPEKKYKIKKDLMKQVKEIISLTMRSGKDRINKNGRSHQFEIFGYDFMLDCDFNLFLIEINTNPGLEISSPWIKIVVPRMLDDALRLTIDKVFEPVYDFSKNYKDNFTEEQKKLLIDSKIEFDFNAVTPNLNKDSSEFTSSLNKNLSTPTSITNNSTSIFKVDSDLDEVNKKLIKVEINNKQHKEKKENKETKENKENKENKEKKENKENKDFNKTKEINKNKNAKNKKENKDIKNIIKENKINKEKGKRENMIEKNEIKYISPFPVPGYSLDENLWEFVCDLNAKDPFEIKNDKETNIDKDLFIGIKQLLKNKEKKINGKKEKLKKGIKGKKNIKEIFEQKEENKSNINIIDNIQQ